MVLNPIHTVGMITQSKYDSFQPHMMFQSRHMSKKLKYFSKVSWSHEEKKLEKNQLYQGKCDNYWGVNTIKACYK